MNQPMNTRKKSSAIMEAFANHNKDYFKADYVPALRAFLVNVPTDLSIYTEEISVQPLQTVPDQS